MNRKNEKLLHRPSISRKTCSKEDREHESSTSNQRNHTANEEHGLDSTNYRPKNREHESSTSYQRSHTANEERGLDSTNYRTEIKPRPPHRLPKVTEQNMQDVHGVAISPSKRPPRTLNEDSNTEVDFHQRLSRKRAIKTERQVAELMEQFKTQFDIIQRQEKTIKDLRAEFTDFKPELSKLKADKNKLQHQHNEEKKDNKQRNKNLSEQLTYNEKRFKDISQQLTKSRQQFDNIGDQLTNNEQKFISMSQQLTNSEQHFEKISENFTSSEQQFEKISEKLTSSEHQFKNIAEQLTNNEQQFENISKQLTQLDTNTNEMKALHSQVDSVNQAQAVLGTSLKQTKDFVEKVQSEMKSDLAEATSQLKEGQASITKDMFDNQEILKCLIQEGFSKKSVENPKKKKAKLPHWHN